MPTGILVIAGVLHLSALAALGWAVVVLSENDPSLEAETRAYIAAALGLVAVAYEVVAFGVHRRKPWAWTASLLFLPLAMVSVVGLIPALVALLFLFNSRVHDWFDPEVVQRTRE